MSGGGIKLERTKSHLNNSEIHLASRLSVFLPLIALTYLGWVRQTLQVGSRALKTGIQYLPVDSMQTSQQRFSRSQFDNLRKSPVYVEKRLIWWVVWLRSSVVAIHATIKFLWMSMPQHTGYTISTMLLPIIIPLFCVDFEDTAGTGRSAKNEYCLYKDKVAGSVPYSSVLERRTSGDLYVIGLAASRCATYLRVLCSLPNPKINLTQIN